MTKKQIYDTITKYCKEHNISKKQYSLFPLYAHFDGFSHSIGFINHKAKPQVREYDYTSLGKSAYTHETMGCGNEHQIAIATLILSKIPHYCYQNNAKEILF